VPRSRRIGLAVAVLAGASVVGVAGAAVAHRGPSEYERSKEATDRPCGRRYVELELGELTRRPTTETVGMADQPSAVAVDPLGRGPALLAQREGLVVTLDPSGRPRKDAVLDLTDDTLDHGDGGLLGLTYAPDGQWLYAYRATDDEDDVLTAYPVGADGRPDQDAEVEILRSGHPRSEQHHGGALAFGPDGMLYLGFGDGGGLGDPRANAQDGGTLLGKLLRIDPTPGADHPCRVPPDNPFVGRDGWRPEIWAYGVRNPFRLSFDPATGDIWLADVGQSCWDEVDHLTAADAGGNLGWDHREGTATFQGSGHVPGRPVWPVHVTAHADGWCAIVGGYVVHDPALPELDGWYLFTDYCSGDVHALRPGTADRPAQVVDTRIHVQRPIGLVQGPDGLPWLLTLEGEIVRITG
jgi:glucose/arabinose dehydrogenase